MFQRRALMFVPIPYTMFCVKNGALVESISIHDVSGRLMGTYITGEIEVENYTPGFYVVKLVLSNEKPQFKSFSNGSLSYNGNISYQLFCFSISIFHFYSVGINPWHQLLAIVGAIPNNRTVYFSG